MKIISAPEESYNRILNRQNRTEGETLEVGIEKYGCARVKVKLP
jgi:DNA-directed RNA polymerase subunit N (RpoN/RPB10)